MRLPSGEGPMPRHLLNRVHWDPKDRPTDGPDWPDPLGIEEGTASCGARDVMITKRPADVTCSRCRRKVPA
jgi:hypothetical protein